MVLHYDIIVVGGGHAGCEAASAAARLGSRTLLVTMDMTKLADMSCNPAVGGVAKGQIVREIDALGGQMGRITDLTAVQFRMLNRSKGAAMWSPRAQCDKSRFSAEWRRTLENTPNLYLWQDTAVELLFGQRPAEEGRPQVRGIRTQMGGGVLGRLCDPDCRDVSGGGDVLRSFTRRGRPCGGFGFARSDRIARGDGFRSRPDEDRDPCTTRCADDQFRNSGTAIRG